MHVACPPDLAKAWNAARIERGAPDAYTETWYAARLT